MPNQFLLTQAIALFSTNQLFLLWQKEYYEDPDNSFSGNGNTYKLEAKNAELERIVGQLYAENEFLKKAIANLEKFKKEETRLEKRRRDL